MNPHPIAKIFPPMTDAEYQALKADIDKNGLIFPVVIYEDKILDGVHRDRACRELKIKTRTEELSKNRDPVDFVVASNLLQRQLNESQRGMIAKRLANLGQGGDRSKPSKDDLVPITQKEAAKMLNVSVPTITRASAVLKSGRKDIIEAVESGKLRLSPAAKIAKLGTEISTLRSVNLNRSRQIPGAEKIRRAKESIDVNADILLAYKTHATKQDIKDVAKMRQKLSRFINAVRRKEAV